jgi:molybdate transport system substrate-binding protein
MKRRSILSVSATIALGLALFGITAGTVRAAEIRLLCAVALHPAIDALIPDFENRSAIPFRRWPRTSSRPSRWR